MTGARRAAIRKAQLASARKRKGKRKKKIAGGVAAVGVIGVTMYAAHGYRKRGKGSKNPVNVVSATMTTSTPASVSKELDLIRISPHDAGSNGIDYGEVGKPMRDLNLTKLRSNQRQLDKRLNSHKKGKGKVITSEQGVVKRVKRNRPGFNDSRRAGYKPSVRKENYLANQEAIKVTNRERARRKRTKSILSQTVLNGISLDTSRYPQSILPFK